MAVIEYNDKLCETQRASAIPWSVTQLASAVPLFILCFIVMILSLHDLHMLDLRYYCSWQQLKAISTRHSQPLVRAQNRSQAASPA